MFDANLILMDGSVVTTTALDTPATSTTRSATTGAVIIDLAETGANGIVAVMFCSDLAAGADAYTLTAYMEASASATFASAIERLGNFGVANATEGVIIGSETPCVATVRFATEKRYVRINATVSNDFGNIKVYLTPWPFKVL